ncbi:myosin-11-like [Punica granatum]|uniref:FRIGIDA-like protein n=1 Tax=Punica granatum TaxID=22663 RepID=A0A6P8EDS6_PUNGR|nr:myosin-11-like [Punica granatum]
MTSISKSLKSVWSKKHSLREAFEQVLLFGLQWEDLEEHFDFIAKSMDEKFESLKARERLANERLRALESKEKEVAAMMQKKVEDSDVAILMKQRKLDLLQRGIDERATELKKEEDELLSMRVSVEEYYGMFQMKQQELDELQRMIKASTEELRIREDKLNVVRSSLTECSEGLNEKTKSLQSVQDALRDCSSELDLKREELQLVQCDIGKFSRQLDSKSEILRACDEAVEMKNQELLSLQNSTEERAREVEKKERHLISIGRMIDECDKELKSKERDHDAIMMSIKSSSAELDAKKSKLVALEKSLKDLSAELRSRERKVNSLKMQSKCCTEEIDSRKEELGSLQRTIKKVGGDLELKRREYAAIHTLIKNHSVELEMKKKQLKSLNTLVVEWGEKVKFREKRHSSVQKLVTECSEELMSKQMQLDIVKRSIEECSDWRRDESDSIRARRDECDKDIEVKMEQCRLLEVSIVKRSEMLAVREKQLEDQLGELKSQQELLRRIEVELRERSYSVCSEVKIDHPSDNSAPLKDAMDLQLFLCEFLGRHDLAQQKVLDVIQSSFDPAKLVLEVLQQFEMPSPTNRERKFNVSITKRSCLLLLRHLSEVSAHIMPQVTKAAMNLAFRWKAQLGPSTNSSFEVLAFLKLLVVYELASAFYPEELENLIDSLSDRKQADELREALGLSREITAHLPPPVPRLHVPRQGMKRPNLRGPKIDNYLHVKPQHVNKRRRSVHERLGPQCSAN